MLENEKMTPLLINLSLPATVGMLVNALYNIVDTIFIGRGIGYLAIGGLAIAFPVQMVIMAIAQMIGIGAAYFKWYPLSEYKLLGQHYFNRLARQCLHYY